MKKLKAVCAIIVNRQNEVLLIKRGREPFKGYWALISGIGESKKGIEPEVGVVEEVNCDLQTNSFKALFSFSIPIKNDNLVDECVIFVGKVDESEIKIRPPFSVEYQWFSSQEIDKIKSLAFEHRDIIKKYFKHLYK